MKKIMILMAMILPLAAFAKKEKITNVRWCTFNIRCMASVDTENGVGWETRKDRVCQWVLDQHIGRSYVVLRVGNRPDNLGNRLDKLIFLIPITSPLEIHDQVSQTCIGHHGTGIPRNALGKLFDIVCDKGGRGLLILPIFIHQYFGVLVLHESQKTGHHIFIALSLIFLSKGILR